MQGYCEENIDRDLTYNTHLVSAIFIIFFSNSTTLREQVSLPVKFKIRQDKGEAGRYQSMGRAPCRCARGVRPRDLLHGTGLQLIILYYILKNLPRG